MALLTGKKTDQRVIKLGQTPVSTWQFQTVRSGWFNQQERKQTGQSADKQRQTPVPTWQFQTVVGKEDAVLSALVGDVVDIVGVGRGLCNVGMDAATRGTHHTHSLLTLPCPTCVHCKGRTGYAQQRIMFNVLDSHTRYKRLSVFMFTVRGSQTPYNCSPFMYEVK